MNNLKSIIGNKKLIDNIIKSLKEHSDSHAYCLLTEDKEMSKEITYAISKAMMCENFDEIDDSCDECKSCQTFASGNNPDFKVISINKINEAAQSSKDKTKIVSVDHIRDMLVSDAIYAPINGKRKVYVIEDADLMTESAQNALLKTLEEPNEYVKIFLLASKESSLLQTIFSRCITLKIMPLKIEEIKKWALRNLDANKYQEALSKLDYYSRYASGSITKFIRAIENEHFDDYKMMVSDIAIKLVSEHFDDFEECKARLSDDEVKDNITEILDILEIWYRDLLFAKNNMMDMLINYERKEIIREQARKITEEKIDNAIKAINKFNEDLKNNASYKLALEVFQINMNEV